VTWLIPAAYALFFALLVYRYVSRRPRLGDYEPQTRGPLVSVIVPARNEAVNIERCVGSILATAYQPVEVIVVDDRSSDATPDIVERVARSGAGHGLRLVRGAELPTGWFGKPWAIVQGYRAARGDLLLFTDADTWHHPELLPRSVAALGTERVDLLSVLARQEMGTFWERLVQPHVLVALASRVGDFRRVNRTRVEWEAIASGAYILTTRVAYERVGTHEAVKETVTEDLALAQAYVRHHLDIFLTHAAQFMSVRMYRSLAEVVAGWSKNLALGVPLMFPPIKVVRRSAPYLMWLPALCWIIPPVLWALYAWAWGWAAATTVVSLAIWVAVYWAEGAPIRYALLYPLGAVMVAYIMVRSAIRGGRVEWRGRVYRSD
jgi:chlorobactene glucosyltransferase